MSLSYIYATFKAQTTASAKVQYLQQLQSFNLPYAINYSNLIALYSKQAQQRG